MVISLMQVTEIGFVKADEHVCKWTDAVGHGWCGGLEEYLLLQALNGQGFILLLVFLCTIIDLKLSYNTVSLSHTQKTKVFSVSILFYVM